jgi:CRP/FNR family transcriptional regulator, nitrogen oxide reductase regulator
VTPDGQQVILLMVGPHQIFGAVSATGPAEYPTSAEAVMPSAALAWDRERMHHFFDTVPRLARNAMELVAGHVQELQDRLREMATERVERRLAHTLLRLIGHAGRKVDEGVLLDLPLTRQDLAEMTGTTLYTVSRILSRWEAEGITRSRRQQVLVRTPHRLVAIAEDLPPGPPESGGQP